MTDINSIDHSIGDMIDHALVDNGGRLSVEYIPEDPEYAPGEIAYFSAALLGPLDEPLAYGRGDTALGAIQDLTPRQTPPVVDEEPL
jgi:hypothetical protein